MDVRELPVDELVLDETLNLRDRLDPETIERYDDAWDRLPPVTVFEVDGRWLLVDGFHRHATALRRRSRTIAAEVHPGTHSDALDYATTANLSHGLPLSRAERRRVVETRLRLHPDFSDRRLSEEMGIGRELISRVRKDLVGAGLLPASATRVGADGKTYPSAGLPRDPNERVSREKGGAGQDDPRDRGRSEADPAPWDDAVDPMPEGERAPAGAFGGAPWEGPSAPWDDASAKALALSPPVAVAEPSIDETINLMTGEINNYRTWAENPDFVAAYRSANPGVQQAFERAVRRLGDCVARLQSA